MAKAKLDKIAKMYHAASALSNNPKPKETDAEKDLSPKENKKKPSKKLDFNEEGGGMKTTIYKDKE